MAASPRYKVVNPEGEYVASFKYLEDASMLVSVLGEKTKVYDSVVAKRNLLWTEGAEEFSAGDSADRFGAVCDGRARGG